MNRLSGKTSNETILKEVAKTLIRDKLKWNLLRCVAVDGSKNMCGAKNMVSWTNLQSL